MMQCPIPPIAPPQPEDVAYRRGQGEISAWAQAALADWLGLSRRAEVLLRRWQARHPGPPEPPAGAAHPAHLAAWDAGMADGAVAFALMLRPLYGSWLARRLAADLRLLWPLDQGDACDVWPDIDALLWDQPPWAAPETERTAAWLLRPPQLPATRQAASLAEVLALLAEPAAAAQPGGVVSLGAAIAVAGPWPRGSDDGELHRQQLDELVADVPPETDRRWGGEGLP